MLAALEADDLGAFARLARQRENIVDHLRAFEHPADVDPNWEREAALLQQQQQALAEAMAACERHMEEALREMEQSKRAHRHYHVTPARTSILEGGLSG